MILARTSFFLASSLLFILFKNIKFLFLNLERLYATYIPGSRPVFKRTKPHLNVGTIGHVDHGNNYFLKIFKIKNFFIGKTTLTSAITKGLALIFSKKILFKYLLLQRKRNLQSLFLCNCKKIFLLGMRILIMHQKSVLVALPLILLILNMVWDFF